MSTPAHAFRRFSDYTQEEWEALAARVAARERRFAAAERSALTSARVAAAEEQGATGANAPAPARG